MNTPDKYDYTLPQFAKLFGCSPGTVKKAIREGKINAQKLFGGTHWRISWEEAQRLRSEKFSPETDKAL